MNTTPPNKLARPRKSRVTGSFQRAVLRGLGVVLPLLLTIVIFIWMWNTVQQFVLHPVETGAREILCWILADGHGDAPQGSAVANDNPDILISPEGVRHIQIATGQWIPEHVNHIALQDPGNEALITRRAIYRRYVTNRYLPPKFVIPVFFSVFIMVLYLLGKFMAARVGRMLWNPVEQLIQSLPFIRPVYGSVKQVTDFLLTEQELEYTRVVAVEYPRKGVWSLGFVTGESMFDLRSAANEPVMSVLMPTSPMPATGFTITIRKSETIDLNLTLDEAFQFIVSCGVVVPVDQLQQTKQTASQKLLSPNPVRKDGKDPIEDDHSDSISNSGDLDSTTDG